MLHGEHAQSVHDVHNLQNDMRLKSHSSMQGFARIASISCQATLPEVIMVDRSFHGSFENLGLFDDTCGAGASFPANSVEQKLNDYGCLPGGVVRLTQ